MHFAMQHGTRLVCLFSIAKPLTLPVHVKYIQGYEDIVLLLKKHGGDVLIKSSMGQLPGGHSQGLGSEFDIKTPFF